MKLWGDHLPDDDRTQVYHSLEEAHAQFGEDFGAFITVPSDGQIEALHQGRIVALDINRREYAVYLVRAETQLGESCKEHHP